MAEIQEYNPQFERVFSRNPQLSDIKPSEWAEKNIIIPGGKGRLNYDYNPYCRKIIDTIAPDHPARKIAVMKGSQITFSSGVIMPALGYIIKEDPHNTYLMVGTQELVKMAVEKVDYMIQGAKLQDYINYQIGRKKNNKSGDTDEIKSFTNGYIKTGAATNPKSIAQVDLERIFLDDFDAMKGKSKSAGSFLDLIEMRAAANMNTYKLMMISTPLLKGESNIEPAFLAGNQERYFVECPCCHSPIIFKWSVPEGTVINPLTNDIAKGQGGIVYEKNNHGQLIKSSVGYVCYLCSGYFVDKNKQNMLREAIWTPTAIPISEDYFSFHISSLYAPVGMFDWAYYAGKYMEANPTNQPRDEYKTQVIVNTCWGETFETMAESPKATTIMKNQRQYEPGTVPEGLSISDGNGKIVLLTCGSDMNGTVKGNNGSVEDDARLDYEILAHSESGATYSVIHGSVGTFIPREYSARNKVDREKWTYEHGMPKSVWPEFEKIIGKRYKTDTGREMPVWITGLDTGYYAANGAYPFLDKTNCNVIGLKGDKEDRYQLIDKDAKLFKKGLERPDLYILQVGIIKDRLAEWMNLRWDRDSDTQPANFMNFPESAGGLYSYENFFEHYEAEHRTTVKDKDGANMRYRWVKKNSAVQNHLFDCRVYNIALREIVLSQFGKEWDIKELRWQEWATAAAKQIR